MNFKKIAKQELYDWLNYISRTYREVLTPVEKRLLGEIRVGVLYGCSMVVINDPEIEGDHPFLSLISYTITNRYLNIYFMLTPPPYRGIGLNKAILDHVVSENEGLIDRVYVITSTADSVAFYWRKGYKFWGLDKKRCLVAELDINTTDAPRKAQKACKELWLGEPLSEERLIDELMGVTANPNYNCSIRELQAKKIL